MFELEFIRYSQSP